MLIKQYCSVCKAEFDMTVVPTSDGEDDGVVWLQCPSCKGFLPKVSSSADFATEKRDEAAEEPAVDAAPVVEDVAVADPSEPEPAPDPDPEPEPEPPEEDPLADMDLEAAVPYRPWSVYAEGDVVHHLAWDDYGVVTAKETLPGNRKVIRVVFAKAGAVRLIEQEGDGP